MMIARLPKYDELALLGCSGTTGSCPKYLFENLSSSNTAEQPLGYWLSAAHPTIQNYAMNVYCLGNFWLIDIVVLAILEIMEFVLLSR